MFSKGPVKGPVDEGERNALSSSIAAWLPPQFTVIAITIITHMMHMTHFTISHHDFLCVRKFFTRDGGSAFATTDDHEPPTPPFSSFSDLPPALHHTRHTTHNTRSRGVKNRGAPDQNHRFATGLARAHGFWVLRSSRQVGAGSRGRVTTDGSPTPHQNCVVSQNSDAPVQRRVTQPRDVEYEFGGHQIRIWGHVFRLFPNISVFANTGRIWRS